MIQEHWKQVTNFIAKFEGWQTVDGAWFGFLRFKDQSQPINNSYTTSRPKFSADTS